MQFADWAYCPQSHALFVKYYIVITYEHLDRCAASEGQRAGIVKTC